MDYKELIKNFTKEDFETNVNLHIHSCYSDGIMNFEQIISQANEKNYKTIAIADHNTINGYLENEISEKIIPAVEFDVWYHTTFFHLLGYGIDVNSQDLKPFLANSKKETEWDIVRIFARRDVKKLITAIHKAGGIAVLAHPACCWCLNLEDFVKTLVKFGLDGLEVYYPYDRHRGIIKFHSRKTVEKIADKLGLVKTGGTDCHSAELQ